MLYPPYAVDDIFDHPELLDDAEESKESEESVDDTEADDTDRPFGLSQKEWINLVLTPVTVFVTVAEADGTIDQKELKAFQKIVIEILDSDNELISQLAIECISSLTESFAPTVEAGLEGRLLLLLGVYDIATQRLPADDAKVLLDALRGLGYAVASASGGFLGFGNKIDKEEQQMLDMIDSILFPDE